MLTAFIGPSSSLFFKIVAQVLFTTAAVIALISSIAYYFGSGRTFHEYVVRYTDEVRAELQPTVIESTAVHCAHSLPPVLQVADLSSIIVMADWIAWSLAFAAVNQTIPDYAVGIDAVIMRNRAKKFNRIYRSRMLQITSACAIAIIVAAQLLIPSHVKMQLGFFGAAKARTTPLNRMHAPL
jgi:hypothetical protein